MMRASRLLSIMILLQMRGRLTAEALAEEFEVSVRTIYRDIDQLSAAGIPVYADRGPGGGFQLIEGYRTRLTGLTPAEARAMFMVGLPGPAAELGIGPTVAAAEMKLRAALPASQDGEAGRISARFHLDTADWYRAAEPLDTLPEIARAVCDQRVIAMKYESWTGTRNWRVEPLGIALKGGAWYLIAQARGKARIFKIANILEQRVEEGGFERPADFDLSAFWTAELDRFEKGLRTWTATLRVSPSGLKRLSGLGDYAAKAAAGGKSEADGWTRLTLPIESIGQASLALIGIGPEFEILEPAELRERVLDIAKQLVRKQESAGSRREKSAE